MSPPRGYCTRESRVVSRNLSCSVTQASPTQESSVICEHSKRKAPRRTPPWNAHVPIDTPRSSRPAVAERGPKGDRCQGAVTGRFMKRSKSIYHRKGAPLAKGSRATHGLPMQAPFARRRAFMDAHEEELHDLSTCSASP